MNREILFRGKRVDNGEWVEGFYIQLPKMSLGATIIANGDMCAEDVSDYIIVNKSKQNSNFSNAYPLEIVECEYYEIDPETLCQYTELTDKGGNRIFENDIVRIENSMDEGIGNIEFYGGMWYVDGTPSNSLFDIIEYDGGELEVIGNISGISDTDDINYCPKCGERIGTYKGYGTAVCDECGFCFGVVECEEDQTWEEN